MRESLWPRLSGIDGVASRNSDSWGRAFGAWLVSWFAWLLLTQGVAAGEPPVVGQPPSAGTLERAGAEEGSVKPAQSLAFDERRDGFAGRAPASRRAALERYGGSEESEAAVKRATAVDRRSPATRWGLVLRPPRRPGSQRASADLGPSRNTDTSPQRRHGDGSLAAARRGTNAQTGRLSASGPGRTELLDRASEAGWQLA